jgi:hypothetical protein
MARVINQQLWDSWRLRIKEQLDSGLSAAEFCAQQKVSLAAFYQWRRKLRIVPEVAIESVPGGLAPRQSRSAMNRRSDFFQVALPSPMATASTTGHWIELTLPSGTVVRLPSQNLAALELVLRSIVQQP